MKNQMRIDVILAGQKALIGSIIPNIRAVFAEWTELSITLSIIYDGAITKSDEEEAEVIARKLQQQFSDVSVTTHYRRIDFPEALPVIQPSDQCTVLYLRKE